MHLVYRALEKEPVPAVLPPALIPPSKRKKTVFPGAVPVLPASPPPKDSLRSTPSHGSVSSLNSAGSLSPKHGVRQPQVRGPCGEQGASCSLPKSTGRPVPSLGAAVYAHSLRTLPSQCEGSSGWPAAPGTVRALRCAEGACPHRSGWWDVHRIPAREAGLAAVQARPRPRAAWA